MIEPKTAFRFTPTCFTCQNRRGSEVPPIRKSELGKAGTATRKYPLYLGDEASADRKYRG